MNSNNNNSTSIQRKHSALLKRTDSLEVLRNRQQQQHHQNKSSQVCTGCLEPNRLSTAQFVESTITKHSNKTTNNTNNLFQPIIPEETDFTNKYYNKPPSPFQVGLKWLLRQSRKNLVQILHSSENFVHTNQNAETYIAPEIRIQNDHKELNTVITDRSSQKDTISIKSTDQYNTHSSMSGRKQFQKPKNTLHQTSSTTYYSFTPTVKDVNNNTPLLSDDDDASPSYSYKTAIDNLPVKTSRHRRRSFKVNADSDNHIRTLDRNNNNSSDLSKKKKQKFFLVISDSYCFYTSLLSLFCVLCSSLVGLLIYSNHRLDSRSYSCLLKYSFWFPDESIRLLKQETGIHCASSTEDINSIILYYVQFTSRTYQIEIRLDSRALNCYGFDILSCTQMHSPLIDKIKYKILSPTIYSQLLEQCTRLEYKTLTTTTTSGSNDDKLTKYKLYLLKRKTLPGTLCGGTGNLVSGNSKRNGASPLEDYCCLKHDLCQPRLPAQTTKWSLTNLNSIDLVHCACDMALYNCLNHANTTLAHYVGYIYFNLLKMKCFHFSTTYDCDINLFGYCLKTSKHKIMCKAKFSKNPVY